METETGTRPETTVAVLEEVDLKPLVMLQLIGAATGQRKVLSVRSLYANIRKYAGVDISFVDFLRHLDSFRDELSSHPGEFGVDVNYVQIKTGG